MQVVRRMRLRLRASARARGCGGKLERGLDLPLFVAVVHEPGILAVGRMLRGPRRTVGDHGEPARERFQRHVAERFRSGWETGKIRGGVMGRQPLVPSGAAEQVMRIVALQSRACRPSPTQIMRATRMAGDARLPYARAARSWFFSGAEPAHVQHGEIVRTDAPRCAQCGIAPIGMEESRCLCRGRRDEFA